MIQDLRKLTMSESMIILRLHNRIRKIPCHFKINIICKIKDKQSFLHTNKQKKSIRIRDPPTAKSTITLIFFLKSPPMMKKLG